MMNQIVEKLKNQSIIEILGNIKTFGKQIYKDIVQKTLNTKTTR